MLGHGPLGSTPLGASPESGRPPQGMFRVHHEQLGEAARMRWGADPEAFLTRDTYVAAGHQPPYDELPTRDEYLAAHQEAGEEGDA